MCSANVLLSLSLSLLNTAIVEVIQWLLFAIARVDLVHTIGLGIVADGRGWHIERSEVVQCQRKTSMLLTFIAFCDGYLALTEN